jgi:hypothetical protein
LVWTKGSDVIRILLGPCVPGLSLCTGFVPPNHDTGMEKLDLTGSIYHLTRTLVE